MSIDNRKAAVLKALDEFFTPGMAEAFLHERQKLLGNKRPVDLVLTESGYHKVMGVIERLRDGVYV